MIDSALPGCKYHPQDIKAVLHPIDYVVFYGMAEGDEVDKIVLPMILVRVEPFQCQP
ncbi:MAG: hypothetical protein JSW05_06635 [Candidatus Thorarchaeota archaeon]|nr:MAG: hypothetical protein JSW05_06635 [Candidatus Thorarchaeota archaeon]